MSTSKDLHIHLGHSAYVKPGDIQLLASPQDYKELEAFLSSHFNTVSFTHDDMGFPEQKFVCPKGSVFVRDENGELVRSSDEHHS